MKHPKVEKAKVALFTKDGHVIVGDCTFVARKLKSQAIFEITIIKKINNKKYE